jgi:hypothetical protein
VSTATCELPQPAIQTTADTISHEVCCVDEQKTTGRIAMCGQPISDGELEDGVPDCMVCLDLIDQWAENADRYGEDPQKPGDDPCRCCPRRFREGLA